MEHIAQGDLITFRTFEDNSTDTNLVDCGLISKAYSAIDKKVVFEVSSAGDDMVSSTTVCEEPTDGSFRDTERGLKATNSR